MIRTHRFDVAIVAMACAVLGWLATEALAAGNGSGCRMMISLPTSLPGPGCYSTPACEGPDKRCQLTDTIPAALGTTAVEWAWNGSAWAKTGVTYHLTVTGVNASMCRCANINGEGEFVSWNDDVAICCTLVLVNDTVGNDHVATMGTCRDGDKCDEDGDCKVVQAAGGEQDGTVKADCD